MTMNNPVREKIVRDFSEWAAFSATRSGCPVKARKEVYPLIRTPDYRSILNGSEIQPEEFDGWHFRSTVGVCEKNPTLPVGWAAKLINVYLKSLVYLAGFGRKNLLQCIHPPIDNGLWSGIEKGYPDRPDILSKTHIVDRIKNIDSYEKYSTVINGCRLISEERGCYLVEVEELWEGSGSRTT